VAAMLALEPAMASRRRVARPLCAPKASAHDAIGRRHDARAEQRLRAMRTPVAANMVLPGAQRRITIAQTTRAIATINTSRNGIVGVRRGGGNRRS
jgi:hypothetical protein